MSGLTILQPLKFAPLRIMLDTIGALSIWAFISTGTYDLVLGFTSPAAPNPATEQIHEHGPNFVRAGELWVVNLAINAWIVGMTCVAVRAAIFGLEPPLRSEPRRWRGFLEIGAALLFVAMGAVGLHLIAQTGFRP